MKCRFCLKTNDADAVFCKFCGSKIEAEKPKVVEPKVEKPARSVAKKVAPTEPRTPTPPVTPPAIELEKAPKKPFPKKILYALAGVMAVVVLAAFIQGAASSEKKHSYASMGSRTSLWDYATKAEFDSQISTADCKTAKQSLVSSTQYKKLAKHLQLVQKAINQTNRQASAFLARTSWAVTVDSSDFSYDLYGVTSAIDEGKFDDWAQKAAYKYHDYKHRKLNPDVVFTKVSEWHSEEQAEFLAYCKIDLTKTEAMDQMITDFNNGLSTLGTMADSVPWYPDGYSEWSGDSSIAWKWVNGSYCNLGDSCWIVKIVLDESCPGGVYGELNILDGGGTVIDYTNDLTGGLSIGSEARLEFDTYDSNAASGRLTELTCNTY